MPLEVGRSFEAATCKLRWSEQASGFVHLHVITCSQVTIMLTVIMYRLCGPAVWAAAPPRLSDRGVRRHQDAPFLLLGDLL